MNAVLFGMTRQQVGTGSIGSTGTNLMPASSAIGSGGWSMNTSTGVATGVNAGNILEWDGVLALGATYRRTFDYVMNNGVGLRVGSYSAETETGALSASGSVDLKFATPSADNGGSRNVYVQGTGNVFNGTISNFKVVAA